MLYGTCSAALALLAPGSWPSRNELGGGLARARVSGERQLERRAGLARQRQALAAACRQRGWQPLERGNEAGLAAQERSRPGREQALRLLESGEANALVAAKRERLDQALLELAALLTSAQQQGWALVALDCAGQTTGPAAEASIAIDPALPYLRDEDLLVIVPHGPLHNLPIHALPAGDGRVIDRWPVAYLPAASALSFLSVGAAGPPAAPLVVGAHFADEARAVADLLPGEKPIIGEEVDKEDVLAAMKDADLIHLSAHGFFSEREPDLSGWIVRPSADLENYLSVREKYGWQRNFSQTQQMHLFEDWAFSGVITASDLDAIQLRASLVAASACESGVIATDPSDDPTGLMPALLASGARGVLATLWLADADTTKTVMLTFYSALSRTSASWSKTAKALQTAVLEAKKANDNPHFWAPYVMIGGLTAGAAA